MNIYENVVILNPSLNEEEVKAAEEKISSLITSHGGEVLKVDHWGKRRLAYELNKQKLGIYILFLFKAPSGTVSEIENYFKVYDPVIKFMVIRLGKKQLEALAPKETEAKAEA